jgi:hypothetical protein
MSGATTRTAWELWELLIKESPKSLGKLGTLATRVTLLYIQLRLDIVEQSNLWKLHKEFHLMLDEAVKHVKCHACHASDF